MCLSCFSLHRNRDILSVTILYGGNLVQFLHQLLLLLVLLHKLFLFRIVLFELFPLFWKRYLLVIWILAHKQRMYIVPGCRIVLVHKLHTLYQLPQWPVSFIMFKRISRSEGIIGKETQLRCGPGLVNFLISELDKQQGLYKHYGKQLLFLGKGRQRHILGKIRSRIFLKIRYQVTYSGKVILKVSSEQPDSRVSYFIGQICIFLS